MQTADLRTCRPDLQTGKGLGLVLGFMLRFTVRIRVSIRVKIKVRVSSSILLYASPQVRSAGLQYAFNLYPAIGVVETSFEILHVMLLVFG